MPAPPQVPPGQNNILSRATLPSQPLSNWMPDAFPRTQQIPMTQTTHLPLDEYGQYLQTVPGQIAGRISPSLEGAVNSYFSGTSSLPGSSLIGRAYQWLDPGANQIQMRPPNSPERISYPDETGYASAPFTAAHEAGHAAWYNDMSGDQQNQWTQIHHSYLNAPQFQNQSPQFMGVHGRYRGDPAHSFAEAYGLFATDPETLQKESPDAFQFLSNLTGFNYRRKGPM